MLNLFPKKTLDSQFCAAKVDFTLRKKKGVPHLSIFKFATCSSMMPLDLSSLRKNYALEALSETDVSADPLVQFHRWFQEALTAQIPEPNAMTLATATREGRPSARIVLVKSADARGFVFFTNYESKKGRELGENPQAALLFNWLELERQIRIEGRVEKTDPKESETYFQSRPKGSQIGAWTSPQSLAIPGRDMLTDKQQALETQYASADVLPLPPFWGGYRVIPDTIEFWQGRPSRLHDRIRYFLDGNEWKIERLAP